MSREESLKQTIKKMREATSKEEYSEAIAEHFRNFNDSFNLTKAVEVLESVSY